MTPKKSLINLRRSALKKIRKLQDKAMYARTLPKTEREPVIAYITIEALNTWNNFLRALYLSCIIDAKSTKGKKITFTATVANFDDAIGIAISTNRAYTVIPPASGKWPRRDEPTWHDINVFIRSCQALNCSYVPDIQFALSTGTRVYYDLAVVRNYYAHRNDSTAQKVKNLAAYYGIPTNLLPTDILFSYPFAVTRPLILNFLVDLQISVEFLCEGL